MLEMKPSINQIKNSMSSNITRQEQAEERISETEDFITKGEKKIIAENIPNLDNNIDKVPHDQKTTTSHHIIKMPRLKKKAYRKKAAKEKWQPAYKHKYVTITSKLSAQTLKAGKS
jgi:hypothetical protein